MKEAKNLKKGFAGAVVTGLFGIVGLAVGKAVSSALSKTEEDDDYKVDPLIEEVEPDPEEEEEIIDASEVISSEEEVDE